MEDGSGMLPVDETDEMLVRLNPVRSRLGVCRDRPG
jgi:hypothetical protein